MLRLGLLLLLVGTSGGECAGQCSEAQQDTSNLIQKHKTVADYEFSEEPDEGWSFQNSFFDSLMDKLSPDAVEDKINQIIGDNGLSLEQAQEKLYGLAHKFGRRLNQTIEAAQDRLVDLQDLINKQGRKVKDASLLQAVNMITQLGDAAVDVAEKVTAEVEEGQLKVHQMVTLLQSEKVESRRKQMQQSLDEAVNTLSGLLHALQDTMRFGGNDEAGLVQLTSNRTKIDPDDVSSVAIDKATHLLEQTDELLSSAKVYIQFVQTRVNAVRDEASRLVEVAGNQTDAAFDLSDKLAADVIAKLGDIDKMLSGSLRVKDAVIIMDRERNFAAQTATSVLVALFAFALHSE